MCDVNSWFYWHSSRVKIFHSSWYECDHRINMWIMKLTWFFNPVGKRDYFMEIAFLRFLCKGFYGYITGISNSTRECNDKGREFHTVIETFLLRRRSPATYWMISFTVILYFNFNCWCGVNCETWNYLWITMEQSKSLVVWKSFLKVIVNSSVTW